MIEYTKFTLDNGLRVVHSREEQTAFVAVEVVYDTGSRDENPDMTGIAHLFEHLMFTATIKGQRFDNILELAGGKSNATTRSDYTEFHEELPAQNIETALYLESMRMQGIDLSEGPLQAQKSVVIEEFKQMYLNRPYGRMMHAMRPLLYANHPYRWPVIGIKPEHVDKVEHADALAWHQSHYAPNNAVLAIAGNVTLEEAKRLAQKWMGDIPPRPIAPRNLVDDPWPVVEQRATIYDTVPQTMIVLGYRMPPRAQRGYVVADVITDILSAGNSSRLYQRLTLGSPLFTMAEAMITGDVHSGLLLVYGFVNQETPEALEQAEEMLKAECRTLAQSGDVTPYELERTKNRYESNFAFTNISMQNLVNNLAMAEINGEDINEEVPRYRSITLDEIAETAREIFIDHAPAVVLVRPHSTEPKDGGEA